MESLPIDAFDKKILTALQLQGRLTNSELAQQIGLSTAATLERVRKLELRGVIKGYHAHLAPEKINLNMDLVVQVKLHSLTKENINAFKTAVERIPFITACYRVIGGETDFFLRVAVSTFLLYQNDVAHVLSSSNLIKELRASVITDNFKESGLPI